MELDYGLFNTLNFTGKQYRYWQYIMALIMFKNIRITTLAHTIFVVSLKKIRLAV